MIVEAVLALTHYLHVILHVTSPLALLTSSLDLLFYLARGKCVIANRETREHDSRRHRQDLNEMAAEVEGTVSAFVSWFWIFMRMSATFLNN